jgi:YfiH family protein
MFVEVNMGTKWIQKDNGICWEAGALLYAAGLRHGVTGRTGGVSTESYLSLNLALHVGDEPAAVLMNRHRLCQVAGLDFDRLTTAQQTHGDQIVAVGEAEAGRGAGNYEDALAHTDAIMTNCSGIPLMLCIADCVPVILFDPVRHACAVVHDGWRGTAALLAAKTVLAMQAAYGSQPQDMLAYVGPSISATHFTVGRDTASAFEALGPAYRACLLQSGSNIQIDLWVANRIILEEAGIPATQIDVTSSCVYSLSKQFFSYRRDDGKTGRMAAFAVLD